VILYHSEGAREEQQLSKYHMCLIRWRRILTSHGLTTDCEMKCLKYLWILNGSQVMVLTTLLLASNLVRLTFIMVALYAKCALTYNREEGMLS